MLMTSLLNFLDPRKFYVLKTTILLSFKDGRRSDCPCITGLEAREYSKSQLSTHYDMIYVTSPNQVNSLKRNTTLDAIVQR